MTQKQEILKTLAGIGNYNLDLAKNYALKFVEHQKIEDQTAARHWKSKADMVQEIYDIVNSKLDD